MCLSKTILMNPPFPPFLPSYPQIAERKPALKRTLVVVFIANEENNSVVDIGVDGLMKAGALEQIKKGPLFWVCMRLVNINHISLFAFLSSFNPMLTFSPYFSPPSLISLLPSIGGLCGFSALPRDLWDGVLEAEGARPSLSQWLAAQGEEGREREREEMKIVKEKN